MDGRALEACSYDRGDGSAGDELDPGIERVEIDRALEIVRLHLGMDVGFVAKFVGDDRVFNHVSAAVNAPIAVGQRLPLDQGYCKKIVDGAIPQVIPDTRALPQLQAIPETRLLPIGSHISAPIRLKDGTVYGTICCFSSGEMPTLNDRDLKTLTLVADLIAQRVEAGVADRRRHADMLVTIRSAIVAAEPKMVYQPVIDLMGRTVIGAEALSRFSREPYCAPDRWFAAAGSVGMRSELEIAAIRNAVQGYMAAWHVSPELHLAVNASGATIVTDGFADAFRDAPLDRIVIEVTEHDRIDDYDRLERALAPLRDQGVRVAVDDAGSGYASLRHVLRIRPDIIKLDISLTRDIDKDPVRRALTSAIVQFAGQTGSAVLAEGIETRAELAVMLELGVGLGQGYLTGRPGPVATIFENPTLSCWD